MEPVDSKAYYGYLFEDNKKPTKILDALLRGIANYIIESVGDKDDQVLSPAKLAAFYHAVGGNYDPLFVDVPHPSLSYIYQSLGCQHILHFSHNDFKPPSIPVLTPRGFVRWESIEILLGPEEHVPFLQAAVRNFAIKHPDTREPFPTDLPKEAFPLKADPAIERWHKQCAEKLKRQASPDGFERPYDRPSLPPRPDIRSGYSHMRNPVSPGRVPKERQQGADYFSSRPLRYKHLSSGDANKPSTNRGSSYRHYLSPGDGTPQSPYLRRRSFPDNYYSPPAASPVPASPQPAVVRPRGEDHVRRHSHPRHRREPNTPSSSSGSDTEPGTSDEAASPTTAPRQKTQTSFKRPPSAIYVSVPSPSPPITTSYPTSPQQRKQKISVPDPRQRLASYKIPIDSSGKLSAQFMQTGARHVPAANNPRVGAVRWETNERTEFPRRGSLNMAPTVKDADENDEVDDEGRRNRDRDWRRAVKPRSGSHDGRYVPRNLERRGRDRDKERYSDRDEKDIDSRREKNRVQSPSKGVDWRKYIPEMLR